MPTLRRTPRSEQIRIEKLAEIKRKSLSQLGDLLGKFILSKPLEQEGSGVNSRSDCRSPLIALSSAVTQLQ